MFTFTTGNENDFIVKFYIKQINNLWNDKKYLEISSFLHKLENNSFLKDNTKKYIKNIYFSNIKLINVLRKIKINQINKKKNTINIPANQTTILAEYTCLLKDNKSIDVYFGNEGKFYRFDTQEIIKMFECAIFHIQYGFSCPFLPKNPFTNTQFTPKDFYSIYNILLNRNKLPYVFILLNLSYYNIDILKIKFKKELYNRAIYTYIENLSEHKFKTKIKNMLNTYNINTCLICLEKLPNFKHQMTIFLRDCIHNINMNESYDNKLKNSIIQYLKEYSLYNINNEKHKLSHRNVRKFRRKTNFKNQTDLSNIKTTNFRFKSSVTEESLIKFKQQKYKNKKRHERYINRNKKIPKKKISSTPLIVTDSLSNEIHNIFENYIIDRNNYHIEISYDLDIFN